MRFFTRRFFTDTSTKIYFTLLGMGAFFKLN
jgi:hypothetical protein